MSLPRRAGEGSWGSGLLLLPEWYSSAPVPLDHLAGETTTGGATQVHTLFLQQHFCLMYLCQSRICSERSKLNYMLNIYIHSVYAYICTHIYRHTYMCAYLYPYAYTYIIFIHIYIYLHIYEDRKVSSTQKICFHSSPQYS
jgi:hypothetical protein